VRLCVYTDYVYHRVGDEVYAERAFALFLARLAGEVEQLTVVGRLDPNPAHARYLLPDQVRFVPLPFYRRLSDPVPAALGMARSVRYFWRALADIDVVWLLGPHPLAFVFAAVAALRGRRIALGVRQNLPEYVRSRHPGSRPAQLAARLLETSFRVLGRFCDVVAVGPAIARDYRGSRRLEQISVSLVERTDLVDPVTVEGRSYADRIGVLSVGRLAAEKNPLLLADVLADLCEADPRWHLVVCGEGDMQEDLSRRMEALGVADRVELRGYVAQDQGLREAYRGSHALLHVSWTEGLPQVIFEAFAAAVPVVATDVGGIAATFGNAVLLVPPGDRQAAVDALRRLSDDRELRGRLIRAGHEIAAAVTLDAEVRRVADFLSSDRGRRREAGRPASS
jgi:glycosyltransferase involved in cell wall biosynthesis